MADYDDKPTAQTTVAHWDAEISAYEKVARKWHADSKKIVERYNLTDRQHRSSYGDEWDQGAEFNVLWSNTQTVLPALFSRTPQPVVQRRHKDPDPIGRVAASVLERALMTEMEGEDFKGVFGRVTLDQVLVARGVPWVRYEADIREIDGEGEGDEKREAVASESCPADYVHWRDFAHAPEATWAEVVASGWVARRVRMTKKQGTKRFGVKFDKVPLTNRRSMNEEEPSTPQEGMPAGRGEVWEIWDAEESEVLWVCRGYKDEVLDSKPFPLTLDNKFPCPEPAYGTLGNDSLIPTPDYLQYRKLADELDDTTARISVLVSAIRVRGFYDASIEGLGRLLEESDNDNEMIPVTNLAALLEVGSGGRNINGVVQFLELREIVAALIGLYDARDRTKQVLFEVSGISDIVRGQVDPREKLGQSRLKGQAATQRLEQRRSAVEQCARDTIRIKAEIISEQFGDRTIRELSGFDQMPEIVRAVEGGADANQIFEQAVALLREERLRGFRVDVETDSTVMLDQAEEQGKRTDFLEAAGSFLTNALPVVQAVPEIGPLVGEMLLFTVRGFRTGRQLESSFEEAVDQLTNAQQEGGGQEQPDPEAQAAQADQQAAQMKAQGMQQKAQMDGALGQIKVQAAQQKVQTDAQKAAIELEGKNIQLQTALAEAQAKMQQLEIQVESARQAALASVATAQESTQ